MGFLEGLGGFASSLGLNIAGQALDYNYNKKLMKYQAQLNEEAAQNNDARTRSLMRDTDTITKQSMRNAGINTAMNGGQSQVGAVSAPEASGVSGASVSGLSGLGTSAVNAFNQFQAIDRENKVKDSVVKANESSADSNAANAHKAESDAQNQDIKNVFEIQHQMDEVRKALDEHKISQSEYDTKMEELQRLLDTHDSYVTSQKEAANQSEIETRIKTLQEDNQKIQNDIANIVKQCNEEQRKQLVFITEHQLEKYLKDMEEQNSRIKANNASAAASFASAAASRAQVLYTGVLTQLEKAKVPYAKQIAAATRDAAVNSAKLAHEQMRGQKLANKDNVNSSGYDENGRVTDPTKVATKWLGDNLRNALGGLMSATKTIK
jgi:galactitol-specific phosphotransferase system IIB component